ncbi:MAG TPA: DUF2569 family protein [Allosphingosinicella sp.]|jgi:chromate transport protein ChrA
MSYDERSLRGVGGWLAFLVIVLAVFTPIRVVLSVVGIYSDSSIAAALGDNWPLLQAVELGLAAANIGIAWYLAWRLNKVHVPQTVRIVIAGLWLMTFGIIAVEFTAVVLISGIGMGALIQNSVGDLVRSLIFCTIWTAYLRLSRRVANTYTEDTDEMGEVFA